MRRSSVLGQDLMGIAEITGGLLEAPTQSELLRVGFEGCR
jgi:hypothetical protein